MEEQMSNTTTTGFIIPVKQAEDLGPKGGGNQPFPEGAAQGTIEDTKVRGLPYLAGKSAEDLAKQGYTSEDVEALSLTVGGITGLDGQTTIGNRKFFTPDIVVRDGAFSITDADIPESAWQLTRSKATLANMLAALGAVEEVEMADGESGYAIANETIEALTSGEFNGQQIGFVVTHRKYTKKDGTPAVQEQVKSYFQVV
jgi:hypothetical protein